MRELILENELKEIKENLQRENIYQNTQLYSGDSVKHMIQLLKMDNYVDILYINRDLKKEMYVVYARFFGEQFSYDEIGKILGLTKTRVQQIEKKALAKLRL